MIATTTKKKCLKIVLISRSTLNTQDVLVHVNEIIITFLIINFWFYFSTNIYNTLSARTNNVFVILLKFKYRDTARPRVLSKHVNKSKHRFLHRFYFYCTFLISIFSLISFLFDQHFQFQTIFNFQANCDKTNSEFAKTNKNEHCC